MHVDLSKHQAGAYAVISDEVPWGVLKKTSRFMNKSGPEIIQILTSDEGADILESMFRVMVKEWNIKDADGKLVETKPFEVTIPDLDKINGRLISSIVSEVNKVIFAGNADPN